jgi:hypothetical protein
MSRRRLIRMATLGLLGFWLALPALSATGAPPSEAAPQGRAPAAPDLSAATTTGATA